MEVQRTTNHELAAFHQCGHASFDLRRSIGMSLVSWHISRKIHAGNPYCGQMPTNLDKPILAQNRKQPHPKATLPDDQPTIRPQDLYMLNRSEMYDVEGHLNEQHPSDGPLQLEELVPKSLIP